MGREEGSGWGTNVYLWQIHFDIWQNQYNIVKLKNKLKKNSTFRKTKIMASGSITSGQIDEETMEAEADFIFLVSKITVGSDCSQLKDACSLEGNL